MARPKKYPDVLVRRAVRLALESGRPIAAVPRDLGINPKTLRNWVRQAEADDGSRRICSHRVSGRSSRSFGGTLAEHHRGRHELLSAAGACPWDA